MQVEDIRGRLLEAKLQNVKLKTELQSRREALEGGLYAALTPPDPAAPPHARASTCCVCVRRIAKCARCHKTLKKCMKACKDASKDKRRDGRELCFVVCVMLLLVVGMLVFFFTVMK